MSRTDDADVPRVRCMNGALHITTADPVHRLLRQAGVQGDFISWRDETFEGPLPANVSLEHFTKVRCDYLATRGIAPYLRLFHDLDRRNRAILGARHFPEIVLWFEHDLYDQLHLIQVLSILRALDLPLGSVRLVQSAEYLELIDLTQIAALVSKPRTLGEHIIAAGASAWEAVTSSDPHQLAAHARDGVTGLPFLGPALRRFCEEFPLRGSGLSRSEQNVLEAVAAGARGDEEIVRRAQAREEAPFRSDRSVCRILEDLAAAPSPLVSLLDDGYELTVLGRRVAGGDVDWLEMRPLDRWVGGVHVTPENEWRWDEDKHTLWNVTR